MSEVAGLLVLTSNYECADLIDTPAETKVVTKAVIQAAEINKLQELGWELVGPSVAVFKKIRGADANTVIVDDLQDIDVEEAFEAGEDFVTPDEEE